MLQELLAALNGITGNIFIEDSHGIIKIVSDFPLISPSEQSLMNELCILGTYYKKMQNFIEQYSSPLIDKESGGLYRVTLSHGINESLSEYRTDLIKLEKELLIDSFLSVSFIKAKLNDYFILFPTLWQMLDCIIDRNLRGCQILDIIFKSIPIGNPSVRSVLNRILNRCNHVLYRQLSAWILRGALFDPYGEFFIRPIIDQSQPSLEIDQSNKSERNFIDNLTKSELISLIYDSNERKRAKSFEIDSKNIPCFLPISLIDKIVFVGESVHLFDRDYRSGVSVNDWSDWSRAGNKLETELSELFREKLAELERLDWFCLLRLTESIESVEKYILNRMWSLLVDENRFLEEYSSSVKDFLLLGRGELFMVFITDVDRTLIDSPVSSATAAAVNHEFLRASRAVLLDPDSLAERFQFRLKRGEEVEHARLRWDDIELVYRVRWPFHIVFTAELLKSYNDLFLFLVTLKRAQMSLNRLFLGKNAAKGKSHLRHWQLRNHMSFLINHLQYYIQVDVIDSQISIFQKKVNENRDIEQLKAAHESLVHSLKSHSFLFNQGIHSGLVKICQVCIDYSGLIDSTGSSFDNAALNKFNSLQEKFYSLSTILFNILNNVEGHATANPHLKQLLVKLDFNSFFSVLGSEIGSLKKSQSAGIRTYAV